MKLIYTSMKINLKDFKSKRFFVVQEALLIFLILLITTDYTPESIGLGLTLVAGAYLTAESLRKSDNKTE